MVGMKNATPIHLLTAARLGGCNIQREKSLWPTCSILPSVKNETRVNAWKYATVKPARDYCALQVIGRVDSVKRECFMLMAVASAIQCSMRHRIYIYICCRVFRAT